MAAEIKLTKTDESPWGFRLTGGRDFGTPLTIIKVTAQSVAEEAGLQVGDILVKINDLDCPPLTHKEAQDLIHQSNNSVTFSVLRGSLSLSDDVIDRLTPLPLRDFKTPEPTHQNRIKECQSNVIPEPTIEVIPIQDLEPELLEELGLNPLPEDFLEKAKRDPSPMPEVRPQSRMASPVNVLQALEDLGLQEIVQEIERQKEEEQTFLPGSGEVAEKLAEEQSGDLEKAVDVTQAVLETLASEEQTIPSELATNAVVPISDEEFAEFISGQEEVIEVEGKNALGVDFKKFEPQADFIRKSQVFRTIQDSEHVLTREEKDKRWTTFMDKPKGPKPKPRPKPNKQQPIEPEPEPIPEPVAEERKGLYEMPSEEEFEALVRLPTPPPVPEIPEEVEAPEDTTTDDAVKQQLEEEQANLQQQLEIEKELNPGMFGVEKSEIELQLEEIQRQLQAIQQLPFEIQQHLALVQQQLNNIVQQRLQEENLEVPACPRPSMVSPSDIAENLEQIKEHQLSAVEECPDELCEEVQPEQTEQPEAEKKPEFKLRTEEEPPILPPPKVGENVDENANEITDKSPVDESKATTDESIPKTDESKPTTNESIPMTDESKISDLLHPDLAMNPKIKKLLNKEMVNGRLSRSGEEILADIKLDPNKKEKPRKKRPFMGLGPAPRPLVLPGGRRWRSPKDAYNDEFIAETLSAQAEIITGSTLGVNFRKYEPKPPGLMHLRDSTVYKMIHDLEDPNVNKGMASRPEIVPAIQDYNAHSAPAAT